MKKTFLTMLALAVAIGFGPLPKPRATTFVNPGSQPDTDNLTIDVKAEKKGKKAKGKKAGKGPGACGIYMYWSTKTHKCTDARNKK
jgi:hypothetical protein